MQWSSSTFFFMRRRPPRSTLFPYTTSSDLEDKGSGRCWRSIRHEASRVPDRGISRYLKWGAGLRTGRDRKSTRLNSSHTVISYAVFCLKKKKKKETGM